MVMAGGHLKAFAIALAAILALSAEQTYDVRSIAEEATTMEPAVRRRATKLFRADGALPPRGAVVWFEHGSFPGRMLLARVAGVPGDRIAVEGGRVVRDGRTLAEEHAERRIELEDLEEIQVPEGYVYVLNDARGDPMSPAMDSRRLGPVPVALVQGWFGDRVTEREEAGKGKGQVKEQGKGAGARGEGGRREGDGRGVTGEGK